MAPMARTIGLSMALVASACSQAGSTDPARAGQIGEGSDSTSTTEDDGAGEAVDNTNQREVSPFLAGGPSSDDEYGSPDQYSIVSRRGNTVVWTHYGAFAPREVGVDIPDEALISGREDAPMLSDHQSGLYFAVDGMMYHVRADATTVALPAPEARASSSSRDLRRMVTPGGRTVLVHSGLKDTDLYLVDEQTLTAIEDRDGLSVGEIRGEISRIDGMAALVENDEDGDIFLRVTDGPRDEVTLTRLRVATGGDEVTIAGFNGQLVLLAVSPEGSGAHPAKVNYLQVRLGCEQFACVKEILTGDGEPSALAQGSEPFDGEPFVLSDIDRVDRFGRRDPTVQGSYGVWADGLIEAMDVEPCCDSSDSALWARREFEWNGQKAVLFASTQTSSFAREHPGAGILSDTTSGEVRVLVAGWEGSSARFLCGDQALEVWMDEGPDNDKTSSLRPIAPPPQLIEAVTTVLADSNCHAP